MDTELPLPGELAAVFAWANGMLLSEETVDAALNLITEAAVLAADDASGAGVSLIEPDGYRSSTASTNDLVAQADALQYEMGQGPCLTAWAAGRPVIVEDVRLDSRWPEWGAAAFDLGLRSCISVPLVSGGLAFGAIKIYWENPQLASPRLVRLLETLAAQAAIFLVNIQTRDRVSSMSEQLKAALLQRNVVGTAKGIIMASHGLDEGEAILHLITRSTREGRTLRDIAQEVIDGLSGHDS